MTQTVPLRADSADSYELPLSTDVPASAGTAEDRARGSLPETILLENILWFCRLRWFIAATFAVFGTICLFPEILQYLQLQADASWSLVTAVILVFANIAFLTHARFLANSLTSIKAKANLWAQILFDLAVITVVVHNMGSLETYAPFTYLFHVVLACIFFSRAESFAVTAIASALYVLLVVSEEANLVSPASIYSDPVFRAHIDNTPLSFMIVIAAITIWFVVWHLASYLSAMVRQRDHELVEANSRLVEAQEAKMRHMLRTTHELKTPFSAIHANAQLLLKGHCGHLSDDAINVVRRISERCRRLAGEIQEMLQLANLDTTRKEELRRDRLELTEILDWSMRQVQQIAEERAIVIGSEMESAATVGVEDHLKMLFVNIISNAVLYSHKGGRVEVRCSSVGGDGALVTVEDSGIGIPKDKLPHIFNEYYRTNEAARHNKGSTGLGLSIVEHIARLHGIRVTVQSQSGVGTKFTMRFGRVEVANEDRDAKEVKDGVFADSR